MNHPKSINFDQGYGFGIGVFETILYTNELVFLKEHLKRMNESLQQLRIEVELKEEDILSRLEQSNIQPYSVVKVMVSDENILVVDRPITYKKEDYDKGLRVMLSSIRRNTTSPFTYMKTFNYGDSLLARLMAKERGCHECILLNEESQVAEGSMTNVFFVKDGVLHTPHEDAGLLPGIVRQWVLDNREVKEGFYTLQDLRTAESIFLTNSIMGIMPVTFFEKPYFIHNKVKKLMEDYWEAIGGQHWIK